MRTPCDCAHFQSRDPQAVPNTLALNSLGSSVRTLPDVCSAGSHLCVPWGLLGSFLAHLTKPTTTLEFSLSCLQILKSPPNLKEADVLGQPPQFLASLAMTCILQALHVTTPPSRARAAKGEQAGSQEPRQQLHAGSSLLVPPRKAISKASAP